MKLTTPQLYIICSTLNAIHISVYGLLTDMHTAHWACLVGTDYGRPVKPSKSQFFWAWADNLGRWILRHLGYLSEPILVLWVPFLCFPNNQPLFLQKKLKPSLSMKILSINDFITKLLSKLLRDLSNRVHLESISKFTNKVINRQYFCKWTCF